MYITKCLHTAILVSNLEKSEYFYSKILGLSKIDRILKYPGVWYQLGDHQIHLIVHENFSNNLDNKQKWGRNPHIALATSNLEKIKETLTKHDLEMQMSASGRAALFTQDPDGNIIEITQV